MIRPVILTDEVRNHLAALETSSRLTQTYRRMYWPMATEVTPEDVIRALNVVGVRPVLMGMHGIGGWRSQARATDDVEVLVRKKDVKKAVRALRQAFPTLKVEDTPVVTRFKDPLSGKAVIDLMKPTQEVFRFVFRYTIAIGATHDIPDLEMALVSKFAAMVSPNRQRTRKAQDAVDFMAIVEHNRAAIDMSKLQRLAEKVYPGGGGEIVQLIADIDAGRTLRI